MRAMDLYLPRGLPARQTQFLCVLATRPSLTRRDYQLLLEVGYITAKRELAGLVAARLIVPLGTTRSRRYALDSAVLRAPEAPKTEPDPATEAAGLTGHHPDCVRIEMQPLSVSYAAS